MTICRVVSNYLLQRFPHNTLYVRSPCTSNRIVRNVNYLIDSRVLIMSVSLGTEFEHLGWFRIYLPHTNNPIFTSDTSTVQDRVGRFRPRRIPAKRRLPVPVRPPQQRVILPFWRAELSALAFTMMKRVEACCANRRWAQGSCGSRRGTYLVGW